MDPSGAPLGSSSQHWQHLFRMLFQWPSSSLPFSPACSIHLQQLHSNRLIMTCVLMGLTLMEQRNLPANVALAYTVWKYIHFLFTTFEQDVMYCFLFSDRSTGMTDQQCTATIPQSTADCHLPEVAHCSRESTACKPL